MVETKRSSWWLLCRYWYRKMVVTVTFVSSLGEKLSKWHFGVIVRGKMVAMVTYLSSLVEQKKYHDDIIVVYLTHFVVCICSFLWLLVITVYSCAMIWSLLLWRNHGFLFCDLIFWNENTSIIMIPLVPSHNYMSNEFLSAFLSLCLDMYRHVSNIRRTLVDN